MRPLKVAYIPSSTSKERKILKRMIKFSWIIAKTLSIKSTFNKTKKSKWFQLFRSYYATDRHKDTHVIVIKLITFIKLIITLCGGG